MKTIEQYKAAAIYFPPGRIVPNFVLRIVKGHKRNKRGLTFGAPTWVLPCGDRFVIFGATELPGTYLMRVNNTKGVVFSAAKGMQNIFLFSRVPVTADQLNKAITCVLTEPLTYKLTGEAKPRAKARATKLQRRRAKFATRRERILDKQVAQFRADCAQRAQAQKEQSK